MKRRAFSLLVTLAMMLTMLPVGMMAEENVTTVTDEAGLRAALFAGGEVVLGANLSIDADDTITIPKDVTTVLDLAGYTLTGVTDDADKNDDQSITTADNEVMIDVRGTLSVKNGTITLRHTGDNFGWDACTEIFYVGFNGALNVENATLKNLGGSDMAFAIDMVNADNLTLNILNSNIESTYVPVRVFNNSDGMNTVKIENSALTGSRRAFWVHNFTNADTGGKGDRESTLNLDIFGNNNDFTANSATSLIEFGFTNPINFDAAGNYIAKNEYALNYAVAKGGKVTLDADITLTETLTIPAGKTVTLDLNGKTIDAAYMQNSDTNHIYAITNNGTLSITGSGVINTRGIYNYGNLTLESGTINAIDGNGGYAVLVQDGAEFVMNGGTVSTTYEDDNLVDNGGYDATPVGVKPGATFELNGGFVTNVCDFTFAIDNKGTATINGGTITSIHSTVSNEGDVTINGGSFTCNGLEGVTAHALVVWEGSKTIINGGTFDGKDNYNGFNVDADDGAQVTISGGNFLPVHSGSLYGEGTITVYGGKFFDNPSARIAPGYTVAESNGAYTVVEDTEATKNFEAELIVGAGKGVKYPTLAAALAAGGANAFVTLLKDVALTETFEISGKEFVLLELDGYDLSNENGPALKISGGTTWIGASGDDVENPKTPGKISGKGYAIAADSGVYVSIADTAIGDDAAFYLDNAEVSIYGASNVNGALLYEGSDGVLDIDGGTYSEDPTAYVTSGARIVKKNSDNNYQVITKSNLGAGVYTSDPTGYLANRCSVSSAANGLWTVVYSAPSSGGSSRPSGSSSTTPTTPSTPTPTLPDVTVPDAPKVDTSSPTVDTKTETTVDGSSVKTETKEDGTVVESVTKPDGASSTTATKTEVKENADGSTSTTTATNTSTTTADGSKVSEEKVEQKVENKDGSMTITAATKTETTTAAGDKVTEEKVAETTENADGSFTFTVAAKTETVTADGKKETVMSEEKTTANADGSATKTTTVATQTANKSETKVVEEKTVVNEDGTTSTTATSTTETALDNGSKGKTTVDETGKVEASVEVTGKAVSEAAKSGATVALPMPEVPASTSTETAPTVSISMPASAGTVQVEVPVENVGGGVVAVLVNADGSETVLTDTLPTENGISVAVAGDVEIKIVDKSVTFADKREVRTWAHKSMDFVSARGIMNGVGDGTAFDPNGTTTRAMVWTMLARLDGVETSGGRNWAAAGRNWAIENGISDGTNGDGEVTREQLATMLHRFVGNPAAEGDLSVFSDHADTSKWAREAKEWAVSVGVLSGRGGDDGVVTLDPTGDASRAEVAKIFMNFLQNVGKK